jgi:type I restriction enzyme M protein
MHWISPSEKDTSNNELEMRRWQAVNQLRADAGLTAQQCSGPNAPVCI